MWGFLSPAYAEQVQCVKRHAFSNQPALALAEDSQNVAKEIMVNRKKICETVSRLNKKAEMTVESKYNNDLIDEIMKNVGDNNFDNSELGWAKQKSDISHCIDQESLDAGKVEGVKAGVDCYTSNLAGNSEPRCKDFLQKLISTGVPRKKRKGSDNVYLGKESICGDQNRTAYKLNYPDGSFYQNMEKALEKAFAGKQQKQVKEAMNIWVSHLKKEREEIKNGTLKKIPFAMNVLLDIQRMKKNMLENNQPKAAFVNYFAKIMELYSFTNNKKIIRCKTTTDKVSLLTENNHNYSIKLSPNGEVNLDNALQNKDLSSHLDNNHRLLGSVILKLDPEIVRDYSEVTGKSLKNQKWSPGGETQEKGTLKGNMKEKMFRIAYNMEFMKQYGHLAIDGERGNGYGIRGNSGLSTPVIYSYGKAKILNKDKKTICEEKKIISSGNVKGLFLDNEDRVESFDDTTLKKYYKKHGRNGTEATQRASEVKGRLAEGKAKLDQLFTKIDEALKKGEEIVQVNISAAASTYWNTEQVLDHLDSDGKGDVPTFEELNKARAKNIAQALREKYKGTDHEHKFPDNIFHTITPSSEELGFGNFIDPTEKDDSVIKKHPLYQEVSQCEDYMKTVYLKARCKTTSSSQLAQVLACYNGTKGSALPLGVREGCKKHNKGNNIPFDENLFLESRYQEKKHYDDEKFVKIDFVSKTKPEITTESINYPIPKMAAANIRLDCGSYSSDPDSATGSKKDDKQKFSDFYKGAIPPEK